MKTIEVNNMPILLDLRFELSLKNLEKYVTKKTPKYIIRSVLDDLDLPRIMASQRTMIFLNMIILCFKGFIQKMVS